MAQATYIGSEHITVFPSARRGAETDVPSTLTNKVLNARVTSEAAFSNIVNKLLDTDGFVIDWNSSNQNIEFNIKGYYFQAALASLIGEGGAFAQSTFVYAGITLVAAGDQLELSGQDTQVSTAWQYQGLKFFDQAPSSSDCTYKLLLLEKTSAGWVVPAASRVKLHEGSLIINVDGGEI